jgi:hypothetical protein
MAVIPLLPASGVEARALLHHILEHGDLVGKDTLGRSIIQLAVDDWTLETLMTFDADVAELEDEADGDAEEDGPAVTAEVTRAKVVRRLDSRVMTRQPAGAERIKNNGAAHGSSVVPFPARVLHRLRRIAEP